MGYQDTRNYHRNEIEDLAPGAPSHLSYYQKKPVQSDGLFERM